MYLAIGRLLNQPANAERVEVAAQIKTLGLHSTSTSAYLLDESGLGGSVMATSP